MAGPRWRRSRLQESRVSQRRPPVGTGVRSAPVPKDCLSAAGAPLLNARKSKVGATQNHVRGPQALLRFDASALRGAGSAEEGTPAAVVVCCIAGPDGQMGHSFRACAPPPCLACVAGLAGLSILRCLTTADELVFHSEHQ